MLILAAVPIPLEILLVAIVMEIPGGVVLTHLGMKRGVTIAETRSEAEQTLSVTKRIGIIQVAPYEAEQIRLGIKPGVTTVVIPFEEEQIPSATQPTEIVSAIPQGVVPTRLATQPVGKPPNKANALELSGYHG